MGAFFDGMTMGATQSAGRRMGDRPGVAPRNDAPSGPGDFHQNRIDAANARTSRSDFERGVDDVIATYNSDAVQNTLMVAPVAIAATSGAVSAMAAGATGTAILSGAVAGAAPIAAMVAVGAVAGIAGFVVGEWIGGPIMEAMGFQRISEAGEMPATVGHPIAHASGWSLGALVVGAIAAVAVVATFGTALVVIAAAAAIGGIAMGFASAAGQYGTNKGVIKTGSGNVRFNNRPVARVTDVVDCSEHAVSKVAQGAETVFANNLPIARIGHKTTCDGTINDGIPNIAIDVDTSAIALDIDVGWNSRAASLIAMAADLLPIGGRRPRDGTPSANRGGDVPNSCRTGCGDPIDVATGQFIDLRTDIFIPGTIPLRLDRCHSRASTGQQGRGWSGTWAQHLRIEGDTITWQTPEGSLVTFHTPADEVMSHNLRFPHLELLGRRSADLFIHDRGLFHVFADEGGALRRLSRIEDHNGNRITFLYGHDGLRRVEHSDGFALKVASCEGLIRSAVLDAADGQDCTFAWDYTPDGRLREVRSSQTGILRYDHDAQGRITGWHDTKDTHVHYEYGSRDRIVRTWTDSGHMQGRLDYDLPRRRTVFTGADGAATVYDWDDDGLVWREIDPLGHVWLTEWDRAFHVTARVDPLGNRTEFAYDARGNMVQATDADGNAIAWEYDAGGALTAVTDPAGYRTAFRHDANGNLVGVTDALGRVSTLGLGDRGQVLRIDLPGGAQQRIHYDPLLRPSRRVDPDGHETRMGHDTEGRLRWFTDEIGATTRYDRARGPDNPRGAMCRLQMSDGAVSSLTWDAEGQLSTITDPAGATRHFRFGAFDLPQETIDAKGHRLRLEHDEQMRLTAVVNELGERHEFTYDAAGNMVAERDYSGRVTRHVSDAAGRMVQRVAADGTRMHYDYSPAGRLIRQRIVGPQGESVTTFDHDPRGLLIRAANDAAVVEYDYDALCRVVAERLNGRQITSDYSVSGQRIARSGDVLHLTASWTRSGLPVEMRIGGHAPLSFRHDPRGLEQLRHSPAGFALAQGHDLVGQLAEQMAGPLLRLPQEARDGSLGRAMPVEIATRMGARAHRSYDWDRAGRAIAVNDRILGTVRFDYDERGQVTTTRRDTPDGRSVLSHFEYDPARNIAALLEAGRSQPVQTVAGRVKRRGTVSYRHDICGRVVEKRVEEPGFRPRVWRMAWDGQDQLTAVATPEGQCWSYRYDPLGRRIARLSGGQGFAYQWEGDILIAEAPMTSDGTVAWDAARHWIYEPGSFRPLAQIDGGTLHYVVTDHLGTPRELFSEDGTEVVWRGELGLWGNVAELRRRAANDDAAPDCPLRFQGQWHDAETGLHYNRFRYYDPEAMQYLSPDPIGLAGGVRPQGYVADPNGWVDPLGLAGCGAAVPQHSTPFQPLTPNQRSVLRARIDARTATRSDYQHLDWDRRFSNRRNRGVSRFWAQERRALRSGGAGTRNWSAQQRADILAGRTPSFGGSPVEGHHRYNALDHPQIADDPGNIYPATRDEHQHRWHGGNWQNDTYGSPNNPSHPEDF